MPGWCKASTETARAWRRHGTKKAHPIRDRRREHPSMTDETLTRVITAMRASPLKGKGAFYRWLWQHYDDLVRELTETDAGWEVISTAMRDAGLVGLRGQPPNRKSLSRVWRRVVRDKTALAKSPGSGLARLPPSRLPDDLKPVTRPEPTSAIHRPAEEAQSPTGRRRLRVIGSLDEARASAEALAEAVRSEEAKGRQAPTEVPAGAGSLPPARWPKPII